VDTEPVTTAEINALTAWARRLTTSGLYRADPGELAAFTEAKTTLLARIRHATPDAPKDTE
jgi:hypothetical protein